MTHIFIHLPNDCARALCARLRAVVGVDLNTRR
jgi:hypothetical protein